MSLISINAPRGADFLGRFDFPADVNGEMFSIADYTAQLNVYTQLNGSPVLTVNTSTATANGSKLTIITNLINIMIGQDDIDALPTEPGDPTAVSTLFFDLTVISPESLSSKVFGGYFYVQPNGYTLPLSRQSFTTTFEGQALVATFLQNLIGIRGLSAYEQAVAAGYAGTKQDFDQSLILINDFTPVFPTFASIGSTFIPAFINVLKTESYAGILGPDGAPIGGATYYFTSRTDLHENLWTKFTSNGRCFVLGDANPITPYQLGGIPGTDVTNVIAQAAIYLGTMFGGGSIFYPPGVWKQQNYQPLTPNIDYYGVYGQSIIKVAENSGQSAHPFEGGGLDRDTYFVRNWKPLNDVLVGNIVTPTSVGDVSHFPAGSYVVVASTGALKQANRVGTANADWQPFVALTNKIIANNGVNLTLESPIIGPIRGAQIALYGDYTSPPPAFSFGVDQWAINCSFHDLTFDFRDVPAGIEIEAFAFQAAYRCKVYNIQMFGAWSPQECNSWCYSVFENVICHDMRLNAAGGFRFIEIKTGSYSSQFRNITGYCSQTCVINDHALIEVGEYANYIQVEYIKLIAPGTTSNFQFLCGTSASPGEDILFKNIYVEVYECAGFVSVPDAPTFAGNPSYHGNTIQNAIIAAPYCHQTVRTVPNLSGGTCQFVVENIKSKHPNASSTPGPLLAAVAISDITGYRDCIVRDIDSDGPIVFSPTLVANPKNDLTIFGCVVTTVKSAASFQPTTKLQPWQVNMSGIKRYRQSLLCSAASFNIGNEIVTSSTSPSNVLFSASFPPWQGGTIPVLATGNTHTNTTFDGLSTTAGIVVGMTCAGPQFTAGTTVTAVNSSTSTVTLSAPAIGNTVGTSASFSLILSGNTHGSTLLDSLPSTTSLSIGMSVAGTQYVPGTYIAAIIDGASVTLSVAAKGTASGVSTTFGYAGFNWAFGDSIEIDAEVQFLGTASNKHVSLVIAGVATPVFTLTVAAGVNYTNGGIYTIKGLVTYYSGGNTVSGTVTVSGNGTSQVYDITIFSNAPANLALSMLAWVDNAADAVQFSRSWIRPRLMYQ